MTAAIIALAVTVAALTVALALSAAQGRRLIGELVAAGKRELDALETMHKVSRERDDAVARAVKAEAERAKANIATAIAQGAANQAREEKATRARLQVLAGTAADAGAALNELLGKDLGGQASAARPADRRDPRDALMPVAELADADPDRRLPKP